MFQRPVDILYFFLPIAGLCSLLFIKTREDKLSISEEAAGKMSSDNLERLKTLIDKLGRY